MEPVGFLMFPDKIDKKFKESFIMDIAKKEIILKIKQFVVQSMNSGLEFQHAPESIFMIRR